MILVDVERTLPRSYFAMPAIDAARDLIGRALIVVGDNSALRAVVVETEAYGAEDDPASHAAFRPGGRAAVMAGEPGIVYVYAAYGMYPCFNIVTDVQGSASAVLVRGIWMDGADKPVLGPGRTTKALGITLLDHGSSVDAGRIQVSSGRVAAEILETPRIGITRGVALPWRFVDRRVEGMRR